MHNRILVLAPFGRDAKVIKEVLAPRQIEIHICADAATLVEELGKESAGTIITEETLAQDLVDSLRLLLGRQPPWSDYPFVVLAARQTVRRSDRARLALQELSNLVLLERPVNPDTLASAVQSALRARRRQYLTREHLSELQQSKQSVERLNNDLETRIAERTVDLASANDRLMHEMVERERVESSRVQNQKMEALGRLTGGIAHDFNNLLHVVTLNLQLIERLAPKEDRIRNFARQAKEAVERGSRLTGQLLSFARTQSLVPKLHDANELIRNMADLIAISVGAQVKLSLALSSGPAHVVVDAAQMEMAILNLAVNSRDAMPKGGSLEIRTDIDSRYTGQDESGGRAYPLGAVHVTVRDTGEGIAPIYKPDTWRDNALLQPQARKAFADILDQGWTDALKTARPQDKLFTFWDYRRKRWERDAGLRIDHVLLSQSLRVVDAGVDREERGKEGASDHAPVWALLEPAKVSKPRKARRQ